MHIHLCGDSKISLRNLASSKELAEGIGLAIDKFC